MSVSGKICLASFSTKGTCIHNIYVVIVQGMHIQESLDSRDDISTLFGIFVQFKGVLIKNRKK
jgi:hypothetical protein